MRTRIRDALLFIRSYRFAPKKKKKKKDVILLLLLLYTSVFRTRFCVLGFLFLYAIVDPNPGQRLLVCCLVGLVDWLAHLKWRGSRHLSRTALSHKWCQSLLNTAWSRFFTGSTRLRPIPRQRGPNGWTDRHRCARAARQEMRTHDAPNSQKICAHRCLYDSKTHKKSHTIISVCRASSAAAASERTPFPKT